MPAQRVTLPVRFGLPNFEVKLPDSAFFSKLAIATVVKIDSKRQQIYVGDGMANRLYSLDRQLTILEKVSTPGPVVDINLQAGSAVATIIGKDFNANNLKNGMLAKADLSPMGIKGLAKYNNFGSLGRPLKALSADFNKDGLPDQLIAEFGNMLGRLTWRENMGKGVYQTHVLRDFPGAIDLKIDDYDHDGLPDIWALFAQADEAIYLYANIGDGKFTEKRIMSFPPSYGSSSFQRIDFNRDGLTDILYTCGDNADLSKILKPYHGIYLYLNEGGNKFKLRYFHPINGCYKAIAKDLDLDGDLDIAAISAFPAAITPWEAFVYLQNNGNYSFQPFALPKDIPFQKGLTMDVGDVDGDGKPELLLGNKFYTSSSGSYREPLLVLLKNRNAARK
ncbi:MAG: VCBS repeat-containing protein [Pedobacter sp.]|nr:MAG: VCBS repeat-containing protein [Pedobacter sp.]